MAFYIRSLLAPLRSLSSTNEDLLPMKVEDGTISSSTHGSLAGPWRYFKRIALAVVPSPIQRRLAPHLSKPSRIHSTSWLDGLRGLASLIVFLHHYTCIYVAPYKAFYGVSTENAPSSPLQLPFIRVIYSGRPMVHIFFVISGFVLSKKPLEMARAHNYNDLFTTLSSSVFRRGIRLFLPATFSTFIMLLFIRSGWSNGVLVEGGFMAQVKDWMSAMFRITQSWAWDSYPTQKLPYDMHTWTLPVEMSMSMLLFITITGLGRCKVPLRFVIVLGMMWYCFGSGHWAAIEFLGGALIAELGLIQDQGKSSSRTSTPSETAPTNPGTDNRIAWTCFWWIQFVIAMWICGWPNHDVDQASGIAWMQDLTPEPYFSRGEDGVVDWKAYPWFVLASLQLVLACHQLPPLQRVLTTAPIQYLGSIGFALYLIHGPMMECLGWRTMNPIWNCVGGQGNAGIWGLLFGWVAGVFGMGIPSLWAADLFWRFVDRPCVNIARWLERKCIEKHD